MFQRSRFRRRRSGVMLRSSLFLAAAALAVLAPLAAAAEPQPRRGGVLDFAVDAEPGNYDCHANVSFAFLHPVAPHYSTLLKFDGADYPQVDRRSRRNAGPCRPTSSPIPSSCAQRAVP